MRDSKTFLHLGYRVKAFDASEALAKLARQHIGQPVRLATFNGFESDTAFEGIWPCASQLHVPAREFPAIFTKYAAMLKPTGRFYCSFKYGEEATLISLQFTPSCSTSLWPGNRIRGISLTDFKSSFQRILIFSQKWLSNMACLVALVCIALTLRAEPRPLTLAFFDNPPYYRVTEQGTPEVFLLKKTITLLTEAEIPFQLRSIPPARILSTIMNNEGGICSPGWFKTDERAAVTRFSEPLYQDRPLSVLFLVKEESLFTPYSTLRALLASPSWSGNWWRTVDYVQTSLPSL